MKKCVVIYNSHSGIKKYDIENVEADFNPILIKYGYTASYFKSKYKGSVTDIVQSLDNDIDLVISIGGDGTFNESMVGNFNREHKLVLAHLPTGTTNDVGKMYGYGKYIWPEGGFYIGNYVNGVKEGYGELHWSNQKVFKGNFKNGKPNGTGIMICDNKEKNVLFKDGVMQGEVLNEKMK